MYVRGFIYEQMCKDGFMFPLSQLLRQKAIIIMISNLEMNTRSLAQRRRGNMRRIKRHLHHQPNLFSSSIIFHNGQDDV